MSSEGPALGKALDSAVAAAPDWPQRTWQVMLLVEPVPELLSLLPGRDLDPLLPFPAVRKKKKIPTPQGFRNQDGDIHHLFPSLLPKVLKLFQTVRPEPIRVFKISSYISALAQAGVIKYHGPSVQNNRLLLLTALKAGEAETEGAGRSGSGMDPRSGPAPSRGGERKRKKAL